MQIAILYGSQRQNRQGIQAAKWAERRAAERGWRVKLIDVQHYDLPVLQQMYKMMETPEPRFQEIHEILAAADGFIVVSGEWNHSIPPALKNLLDHFQPEYNFKPSGIVTYSAGVFGGVRALSHVRAILAELGTPSIPTSVPVPKVQSAFKADGSAENEILEKSIARFLDEFDWYLKAFKAQRDQGTPY